MRQQLASDGSGTSSWPNQWQPDDPGAIASSQHWPKSGHQQPRPELHEYLVHNVTELIKWPGAERLVESVGGHDAGKAKHVIQHNKTRTGVT